MTSAVLLMPVQVLIASHDEKGHITPYFEHVDLRNAMVPLMMPLA